MPKTATHSDDADPLAQLFAAHPEANFTQSPAWQRTNQNIGHQTVVISVDTQTGCLGIIKDAKRGRYLEIPGGPLVDWQDQAKAQALFKQIRQVATEHRCVFVRLRPQLENTPENRQLLAAQGLKIAPMHLAAEHTVILDLSKTEDELLADLRRQTRYEVRRADKKALQVTSANDADTFREFHRVQAETAARQNFVPPDEKTLLAERTGFGDDATIYIAKTAEGEPVAYGLILKAGQEADYYEAASTPLNRKLPGAYALQWRVIRDFKAQGFQRYNLWGIAPPNSPHHRYAGVTTFKTGFGGRTVEFVPAHDLVLRPVAYLKNLAVETVRKKRRKL